MSLVTGRGQDPGLALIEGPEGTRHEVRPDRLPLPGPSSWKNRAERSRQGLSAGPESGRCSGRSAGPRASSREGRVGPVPARDLEGVWGRRGNQGRVRALSVPHRDTRSWASVPRGALFPEGLRPACGGETAGTKAPLRQAAGMCPAFLCKEKLPPVFMEIVAT